MFYKTNFFYNTSLIISLFFSKIVFFNIYSLDIMYRCDLNDNFINFFSFFWTNFWYLPLFFVVSYLDIINFNKCLLMCRIFLCFPVFFYYVEINNYLIGNHNFNIFNLHLSNFNFFLLNNINKYHPAIFYLSVFLFLTVIMSLTILWYKKIFMFYFHFTWIKVFTVCNLILFFNSFTLFLGSWWALQEGSWGGWWNWDSSETFGLLFLMCVLIFYHYRTNYFNFYNILTVFNVFNVIILLAYYFIQLNYDVTSHNFGVKFFFFFNNNLFLLEVVVVLMFSLTLLTLIFIFTYFKMLHVLFKSANLPFLNKLIFFLVLLILVICKPIVFSFLPLINYFVWNFFHLNLFNFESTSFIEIYFIVLCLTISMFKFKSLTLLTTTQTVFCHYNFLSLISLNKTKYVTNIFHFFILNFLLFNLLSNSVSLSTQAVTSFFSEFYSNNLFFLLETCNTLNNFFTSTNLIILSNLLNCNSFYVTNILKSFSYLFFEFFITNNFLFNVLFLNSSNYENLFLYLEFLNLNYLLVLFVIIFFFIFLNLYKPLIKFKNAVSAPV